MKNHETINTTDKMFYDLLKQHINDSIPLSFARFGDGEIMHLNKSVTIPLQKRYCQRWGYKWPAELNSALYDTEKILHRSLRDSDILGILNINSVIAKKIAAKNKWSITKQQLTKIRGENSIMTVDHQITRGVTLGNIHEFKKILNNHKLHIISSRTSGLKKNKLHELLGVDVSYTHVDFMAPMTHRIQLFKKLDKIEETVVLVGLGMMGKDIPAYLKKRGKICLDWGATLDAWAGLATRPWFKKGNLQDYCLIK